MRLTALLWANTTPAALRDMLANFRHPEGVDPRNLHVTGVKIGADGIPRFRTAWMNEPYLDGTHGRMTLAGATPEEQVATLHGLIQVAADAGFQVGTHACGSATTDAAVEGYVKTIERSGRNSPLRHCVHHCNFPSAKTLKTMAQHGIAANLNGEILYLQGRVIEPMIGAELTEYQWPYRSALAAGVRVTSGSDAPVVDNNHWLQGVMAAVVRQGRDGSQAGTDERISVAEALATYTRTSAWLDRAESWKGTLEPGKVADICIVDGDLLRDDPKSFATKQANATILGGKVVYERAGTSVAKTASAGSSACQHDGPCCCQVAESIRAQGKTIDAA
jgi:predicted amidohydrolase YtcJ